MELTTTPVRERHSPLGATLDRPRTARVPGGVLHTAMSGALAVLGPWTPDVATGCSRCAGLWRSDVEGDLAPDRPAPADLFTLWEDAFAQLVTATAPAGLRLRLLALDCRTGEVTRHSFVPHPRCGHCFPGGEGLAPHDAGGPDLQTPLPVVGDALRTRAMDRNGLRERLLDFRFGPVAHVYRDEEQRQTEAFRGLGQQ